MNISEMLWYAFAGVFFVTGLVVLGSISPLLAVAYLGATYIGFRLVACKCKMFKKAQKQIPCK